VVSELSSNSVVLRPCSRDPLRRGERGLTRKPLKLTAEQRGLVALMDHPRKLIARLGLLMGCLLREASNVR
jgi:hypothetical protein